MGPGAPDSLAPLSPANRIRREQPALQQDWRLDFQPTDNDQLLCYVSRRRTCRTSSSRSSISIITIRSGQVTLDLKTLGIAADKPFQMHVLNDALHVARRATTYSSIRPFAGNIFVCAPVAQTRPAFYTG
jgi:starch synthase (maltosyl-transferring)